MKRYARALFHTKRQVSLTCDSDTILLLRTEVSVLLAGFVGQSPMPGDQPRMDTETQLSHPS